MKAAAIRSEGCHSIKRKMKRNTTTHRKWLTESEFIPSENDLWTAHESEASVRGGPLEHGGGCEFVYTKIWWCLY